MMKLLTEELREKIPPLYATENEDDPVAYAKFFTPDSSWTWYVLEFDGEDRFFGYVVGHFSEFGYFTLRELKEVRGHLGLPVERDIHWQPRRLSEIQ